MSTSDDDNPAINATLGTLVLAWPLLYWLGTDSGFFWSLFVGLGGTAALGMSTSILSGLFEGAIGGKYPATIGSWLVGVGISSFLWWQGMAPWAAASLTALAVIGVIGIARRTPSISSDGLSPELSTDVERAITSVDQIRRSAEELGSDELFDASTLVDDAEQTLEDIERQARRLSAMETSMADGGTAVLKSGVVAGQARMDQLLSALNETRDQLLVYLQERDGGTSSVLQDRVTQLRLAAEGLREIHDIDREYES